MVYKRYLLTLGGQTKIYPDHEENDKGAAELSMGEDEKFEVMSKNSLSPRTWWKNRLKMK